jgi:glycosyltransferase involved in cell wall biosynthesis
MKVLLIVGEFPPQFGGFADGAALLAREIAALGPHVTVLTTRVKDQENRSFREGVEIRRVMCDWRLSEIRSILGIIDEMGRGTIVHLWYPCVTTRRRPMVNFLPLFLRMFRPHCRVVVTIHEFRTQRTRYRVWALPLIMAAHGLIFVDPPDLELLLRWTKLKRPRIECIPIAPNILPVPVTDVHRRAWRQRLGVLDNTPIVTFFGGILPPKGLLGLLEAMNRLRHDAIPGCLLVIGWFGPDPVGNQHYEREVREALAEGLSAGWIKLREKCPSDAVSEYLHASDVAVFPFVRGARSNNGSLLAALAHGLPVVATRGVDTPEGFAEQYGVELVPAGSPGALANCLGEILLSEEQKNSLRARALQAARAFSWPSIACATAAFYSSLRA